MTPPKEEERLEELILAQTELIERKREVLEIKYEIGKLIEEKRKNKKITLRQLAKRINRSAAYLSDIEKGKRCPSYETYKFIISKIF